MAFGVGDSLRIAGSTGLTASSPRSLCSVSKRGNASPAPANHWLNANGVRRVHLRGRQCCLSEQLTLTSIGAYAISDVEQVSELMSGALLHLNISCQPPYIFRVGFVGNIHRYLTSNRRTAVHIANFCRAIHVKKPRYFSG